ncbi:pyridoxal kinase [Pseudochrobactrum sp. Wa41.01b-1]|uniref:pyridoxal kinase n=1 Tax=Pseudochrobactrum sp. Wa41.01b-1 TaxID=2864102 RepID=UPI001C69291C|nr:pyridoxal kinase [Pseudochrobactrum sp. Wa41.01b-1]MBX8783769.1 pyridoxal kinase [Ochrobactrum sp. GRS2]QYM73667.1 pyridoxal kinase [Pseudochrobactrum sp. Wa41.01b-1]
MSQPLSMQTSVISIQSQVVYGHVGNSAAVLPMQARGLNVAAVPTTLLSNHPGYETMRGRVLEPELVSDLLRGVEERGLISTSRYIVSGYLGSRANGEVVADFVKRARKINPEIIYICDPVMGDTGLGVFVADPVVDCIINELVPLADLLTPNQFEVGLITGSDASSFDLLREKVQQIQAFNNVRLIATGCVFPDTPYGSLENVVFEGGEVTRLTSPRVPIVPVGTGDLFTGTLTANLAHGCTLTEAARNAASTVLNVVSRTAEQGEHEMQLGSAIDILVSA